MKKDPNQSAKAVIDAIIAKTERPAPRKGDSAQNKNKKPPAKA